MVFCSISSFSEHTCPQLCSSSNRTAPLPPGVCALLEQPALLSLCAALGRRAVSRRHLVMTPTDTEAYYKLTGPLLGKFNQMPKKCICVFNICTGYVVAVKNVATLVPSPHLRSRCWWLFGRWTAGRSIQVFPLLCLLWGGFSFLHEYNIHHLGLRFLCHI